MVYNEQPTDSTGTKAIGSIINALLFVGMIVLTTVIFVVLYKYRCLKVRFFKFFLVFIYNIIEHETLF